MSARRRRAVRRVSPRLVGAGAAGLAVTFAAVPHAVAQAPAVQAATPDPTGMTVTPAGTATTSTPAPTPNYGYQKVRVGVQIAPGT